MRRAWLGVAAAILVVWGVAAYGQAVSESIVWLIRVYVLDPPLDIIGGVQTEPVESGLITSIDGGPVEMRPGIRTDTVGKADGGVLLGTGAGAQFNPLITGDLRPIDGGYISVPWLDAGVLTVVDSDKTNATLTPCTMALDTHWRGTILGDYICVGAIGKWARYNTLATTIFPTGNEPGTFKGPIEGVRFFIDPPAPVAEPFRCYALTATVNAQGTCIGICAGLPVEQRIARLAVGQDIAGNLCYVDVPCTAARENVYANTIAACGADAGSTGVRTFFWFEPGASGCTENPVITSRIVCNIVDG